MCVDKGVGVFDLDLSNAVRDDSFVGDEFVGKGGRDARGIGGMLDSFFS